MVGGGDVSIWTVGGVSIQERISQTSVPAQPNPGNNTWADRAQELDA
jgi:hypothetical protein